MLEKLSQQWDLETIFPGGSRSQALVRRLDEVEAALPALREAVSALGIPESDPEREKWISLIEQAQAIMTHEYDAGAFIYCLMAGDARDEQARILYGRSMQQQAALESMTKLLNERILRVPDAAWEALLADSRLEPIAFGLRELRTLARDQMEPAREMLATDLAVDGYHAWRTFYMTLAGRITIPFQADGTEQQLSVSQAVNKLSSPDPAVRSAVFTAYRQAWEREADLCAEALNHIAGFRLNLYRARGWDSFLKEPLAENRMTEQTLDAMWEAIASARDRLSAMIRRRALVMGNPAMPWYDQYAPLSTADQSMTYEEAASFVVEQFGRFDPAMASFAAGMFRDRWIEAEDRPGKGPGAFAISFPGIRQSRIFMTFGGTAASTMTLAHELGHTYHNHVLEQLPLLAQNTPLNLAETASTFAETIVLDAAIAQASSPAERLALLDGKMREAIASLMNIRARFLFEVRFHRERRQGPVGVRDLNRWMEEAQREAFGDDLQSYYPLLWASTRHFYRTQPPFYNFPYAFGYLFSLSIYARAREEGPAFASRYADLLRDTGRMYAEELARRHLGADLTRPAFWNAGIQMVLADVDEFMRLTEESGRKRAGPA